MNKIKTIIRKEWAEVFKNRMVIFTVAFLPLLLTALPLGIIFATRDASSRTGEALDSQLPSEMTQSMCPEGVNSAECFQIFMVSQFMMMFMIVPVAIPVTIAAYSIVGEKTTRSLEPLLATPITTIELLVGKCLAAVIPAVLATYAAFGLFALGSWLLVANKMLLSALLDARWLIAIFIVGPLLALMSVAFALMVSSRVSDPRVAEQVSMVIIVPVLVGLFGQMAGLFVLNKQVISSVAVVMLALDALLVYLATRVFQRESILTRWK
ncbi:MAG: ABC transporter permease subunit [Anaerolineales bacterium]|nr:ABC transporter permease subunit [Anaerolineales bacterium]